MRETIQFEYDCPGDEITGTPSVRTVSSISAGAPTFGAVARKFAEFMIASGWSPATVEEYLPGWEDWD